MRHRSRKSFVIAIALLPLPTPAKTQSNGSAPKVVIQVDGTVEAPARSVPPSSLLTEKGKQYLSEHLHQMQDPNLVEQVDGVPRFMRSVVESDYAQFAFDKKDE